jgi:hypothetical protein
VLEASWIERIAHTDALATEVAANENGALDDEGAVSNVVI